MIINESKYILFINILLSFLLSIETKRNLINDNIDNISTNENKKLLFVWEHFRHGARVPDAKVNKKTWIDFIGVQWKSEGELNEIGLRAHYLLGIATKNRYKEFLSKSFDTNEMFIISSDKNRTIVSAMANLQGIYKNYTTHNLTENQIKRSNNIKFNQTYKDKIEKKIEEMKKSYVEKGISIMPIHLFSRVGLQFRLNEKDYCPGITKYKEEAKNQPEVKKYIYGIQKYTNETYGKYIFQFMNVSLDKQSNYLFENDNLYFICDTYIADYVSGREMPHIYKTNIDMDQFYYHCLNNSIIDLYYGEYGLPPTKGVDLIVSPIFRTIFNYMDRRIALDKEKTPDKLDPSSPRFVIYSGHDSTIAAIDVFLKKELNISYDNPEYTTSQLIELWRNETGYFVTYLYNQEEKAVFNLNYFKEKINKAIFSENEVYRMCGIENDIKNINIIKRQNLYETTFIISIGMVIISLSLLISVSILKRKNM